jgi:hypothetical protein
MHSNNYEWFITQTVESMLPTWHDKDICLAMKIDMSWDYFPDDNDKGAETKSFRKEILLIFHRPMNYTKVLCRDITNKKHVYFDEDEMEMEQLSDHDSCWRSDGMNWVFKTFVEAWDYFDQFKIEGRKIEPMFHYSLFRGSPAYYHLEKLEIKDSDDRWNSSYIVKVGKQIKMNEISQYMKSADLS